MISTHTPPPLALLLLFAGAAGCAATSADPDVSCESTCAGCCVGGMCLSAFDTCGGATCWACSGDCKPGTCADGCCDGRSCAAGESDEACGRGGKVCRACAAPSRCEEGHCLGIQGERCDDKRPCVEGLHCVRDYVDHSAWPWAVALAREGTCRAPCNEQTPCGSGLWCKTPEHRCVAEVTERSRWFVLIGSGRAQAPEQWDDGAAPNLVVCVELDGTSFCKSVDPRDETRVQSGRTFDARALEKVKPSLWDDDGEEPFLRCQEAECRDWERAPRQELSSDEGDGRSVAVPLPEGWYGKHVVRWPAGEMEIELRLDEVPRR